MLIYFYHINIKTNIQHTYSVNISDQVPARDSKTWGKSSAEALGRAASAGTEYFKKNGRGAPDDESKSNYSDFIISYISLKVSYVLCSFYILMDFSHIDKYKKGYNHQ